MLGSIDYGNTSAKKLRFLVRQPGIFEPIGTDRL